MLYQVSYIFYFGMETSQNLPISCAAENKSYDRQYTSNTIRVRITIFAVEKQ